MSAHWRKKLWVDFDRDATLGTIQIDDDDADMRDINTSELSLDNHNCTTANLGFIRDSINGFDGFNNRAPLLKLDFTKILFTELKADILRECFESSMSQIRDLEFDKCRAKRQEMCVIFDALSKAKKLLTLSLQNMNIPRDAIPVLS